MGKAKCYTLRAMFLKKKHNIYYVVPIPTIINAWDKTNWEEVIRFPANSLLGELIEENFKSVLFIQNEIYGLILASTYDVSKEFK